MIASWREKENGNFTARINYKIATVYRDKKRPGWRWAYDDCISGNIFANPEEAKSNVELVVVSSGLLNVRASQEKSTGYGEVVSFPNHPNRARYRADEKYRGNRKS